MLHFHTPRKYQETLRFLIFSGGIELQHSEEIG